MHVGGNLVVLGAQVCSKLLLQPSTQFDRGYTSDERITSVRHSAAFARISSTVLVRVLLVAVFDVQKKDIATTSTQNAVDKIKEVPLRL